MTAIARGPSAGGAPAGRVGACAAGVGVAAAAAACSAAVARMPSYTRLMTGPRPPLPIWRMAACEPSHRLCVSGPAQRACVSELTSVGEAQQPKVGSGTAYPGAGWPSAASTIRHLTRWRCACLRFRRTRAVPGPRWPRWSCRACKRALPNSQQRHAPLQRAPRACDVRSNASRFGALTSAASGAHMHMPQLNNSRHHYTCRYAHLVGWRWYEQPDFEKGQSGAWSTQVWSLARLPSRGQAPQVLIQDFVFPDS